MSDDETTEATASVTPADEPASTPAVATASADHDGERRTVQIPQWLAGALVVVLAFAIGAVGYAIGASENDGPSMQRPISATGPASQQGGPGGMPGGPSEGGQGQGGQRGPGGMPGMPGGPNQGGQHEGGRSGDDRQGDRQSPPDQGQDQGTQNQDDGPGF